MPALHGAPGSDFFSSLLGCPHAVGCPHKVKHRSSPLTSQPLSSGSIVNSVSVLWQSNCLYESRARARSDSSRHGIRVRLAGRVVGSWTGQLNLALAQGEAVRATR
jgi:hypothetical protein